MINGRQRADTKWRLTTKLFDTTICQIFFECALQCKMVKFRICQSMKKVMVTIFVKESLQVILRRKISPIMAHIMKYKLLKSIREKQINHLLYSPNRASRLHLKLFKKDLIASTPEVALPILQWRNGQNISAQVRNPLWIMQDVDDYRRW